MVFLQHFFIQNNIVFLLEQTVFNVLQTFQTYLAESSTKYGIVIHKYCSIDYPVLCHPSCASVMYQLSSLTIIYFIIGVKSFSPTFSVAISKNYRPPSHQSIFVSIALLTITYKMHSPCNVTCVFGILTIISHTYSSLTIQYNERSFFWNYICILVKKFMN